MSDYKHVLVALDLSAESTYVGEHAVDLARRFGAKVSLIHVVEQVGLSGVNELAPPVLPESPDEDAVRHARASLDRLAEHLNLADAQKWVMASSKTRDEIVRIAQEQHVDLIVVGSHGRHGLALLFGSTANAILHNTPCDVLAVRLKS